MIIKNPSSNNSVNSSTESINVETLTSDKQLTNNSPSIQDLTNAGTVRLNLFLPSAPLLGKLFSIINEDDSLGDFLINNTIVPPGDRYEIFWNDTRWVEL